MEKISKPAHNKTQRSIGRGDIQRQYSSEMYAGSFISNGERMEIRRKPNPRYSDPVFIDEKTQKFNGLVYKLWNRERYLSRKTKVSLGEPYNRSKRLHRDVWEGAFGEIPEDCHIHHKDGNPINNALWNLECMQSNEHLRLTWQETYHKRTGPAFTDEARKKAAEWHRSDEGMQWHKNNNNTAHFKKKKEKKCLICGTLFMGIDRPGTKSDQKYCKPQCKNIAGVKHAKNRRAARRLVSDRS